MRGLREGEHRFEFIQELEAAILAMQESQEAKNALAESSPDTYFSLIDSTIMKVALRYFGTKNKIEEPELAALKARRLELLEERRNMRLQSIDANCDEYVSLSAELQKITKTCKQARKKHYKHKSQNHHRRTLGKLEEEKDV